MQKRTRFFEIYVRPVQLSGLLLVLTSSDAMGKIVHVYTLRKFGLLKKASWHTRDQCTRYLDLTVDFVCARSLFSKMVRATIRSLHAQIGATLLLANPDQWLRKKHLTAMWHL